MRECGFVTESVGNTSHRYIELMNAVALYLKHPREGGWARKEGCRNSVWRVSQLDLDQMNILSCYVEALTSPLTNNF